LHNILIPLSMVVGVCKQQQQSVNNNGRFFMRLRLNTSVDHVLRRIKLEQRKSLQI